ncbi:monosaccharide transporter [Colletotrichum tabaci]|uniref:Monosaccharide transporter n=1 Tax=Colletotrichum tabaci TaxID=1209068 RepID=A0AAV9TSD5_9PEZI
MDSDEGLAILGTTHGASTAWMLIQHKQKLGLKTIKEVVLAKSALSLSNPATAGTVLDSIRPPPAVLIVGRFMLGVAVSFISIIVPAYLTETSNANNKRRHVVLYSQLLIAGNLLAKCISLETEHYQNSKGWRITIAFQLLFVVIVFLGAVIFPESPPGFQRRTGTSYLVSLVLATTRCLFNTPSIDLIEKLGRSPCLMHGSAFLSLKHLLDIFN